MTLSFDGVTFKDKGDYVSYDVVVVNNPTNMGYGFSLKRGIEIAKNDDERYPHSDGSKHDPKLINFASIFGPKTEGGRYNTKKGLQGLKWSEITDDDFKVYKPTDKELVKLIKRTYGKKDGNADFIVVDNKDNVINFIKAYGKDPKEDGMFYFKAAEINKYGSKIDSEVRELTKPYYSHIIQSTH